MNRPLPHYEIGEEARLYERWIFSHRKLLLALFVLVTGLLGWQAAQLRPDASFEKMIPMGHPYIQTMIAHIDDIGAAGTSVQVVVAAREGDIFAADYMEILRQATDEALGLPGVYQSQVQSLWTPNVRWTEVTEEGFDGGTVIPDTYDGSAASLAELRANVLRSGLVGRLVADDLRSSIIEVPLIERDPATGEALDYVALSRLLEERLRERFAGETVSIHIAGFAKLIGDLIEGIGAIVGFAAITLLITLLLLYGFSRCPIATVAPLLCSLVAVVWQLGLLHALGYGINAYSMLVPFLVFAIGVSHGVQVINAVGLEMGRGADALQAARLAYRALYLPGIIALISDGLGFITLFLIDIAVIQELGIAASLGVAAVIFTNLVLLPLLLSYLGVSHRGIAHQQKRRQQPSPWWPRLAAPATRRVAPWVIAAAVVLLVIGTYGGRFLQIGDLDAGAPELRADARYNRDIAFINGHYAVSSDVLLVIVKTAPESCSHYDNLALIDRFAWTLENTPGVQSAVSLVTVSKQVLSGFSEGSLKWQTLSRDQQALDGTFFAVPPALVNRDCSYAPVILFLADHKADTLATVTAAVEAFAREHNSERIRFLLGSGNAGIEAATNQVIAAAQNRMLWLIYGVVCMLVLVTFRSLAAVACIVLPLALTSVLCQALMAGLGIGVKVSTLPVIALGVGVGVDYSIYIYGRLEGFLRQGRSLAEAWLDTLRSTGQAVGLTGLALAIGVATWMFSPIKFQADMGTLLVFMFLWNMLGALLLLPALACFLINPARLAARGPRWQDRT